MQLNNITRTVKIREGAVKVYVTATWGRFTANGRSTVLYPGIGDSADSVHWNGTTVWSNRVDARGRADDNSFACTSAVWREVQETYRAYLADSDPSIIVENA